MTGPRFARHLAATAALGLFTNTITIASTLTNTTATPDRRPRRRVWAEAGEMFGRRSRGSGGDTEYKSRRGFGYHVRHGQGRAQQRHRSGHIGGREIHRGGAKDFEGNECRTGKGWYFGQEPVYVYSPSFFFSVPSPYLSLLFFSSAAGCDRTPSCPFFLVLSQVLGFGAAR